jgi:hypothetical protein
MNGVRARASRSVEFDASHEATASLVRAICR